MEATELNERAKAMFPAEWAHMERLTGKRRSRRRASLRARVTYEDGMAALPAGAACGNCEHKDRAPSGALICDLDSDFYGYAKVKPDHRCPRWTETSQ